VPRRLSAACTFVRRLPYFGACPAYLKIYPELASYEVDEKYVAKYGVARIIVPPRYLKRRRRVPKCATTPST
jgi:hypothetical protein